MNKETYEALKLIIAYHNGEQEWKREAVEEAINQVEGWIDEVAKDYMEEVKECEHKNTENGSACICSDCGEVQYFEADED